MTSSYLTSLKAYHQIQSRSEVLGVRISTYQFGGGGGCWGQAGAHHSTHNTMETHRENFLGPGEEEVW